MSTLVRYLNRDGIEIRQDYFNEDIVSVWELKIGKRVRAVTRVDGKIVSRANLRVLDIADGEWKGKSVQEVSFEMLLMFN